MNIFILCGYCPIKKIPNLNFVDTRHPFIAKLMGNESYGRGQCGGGDQYSGAS
jgi:hypothetical protein